MSDISPVSRPRAKGALKQLSEVILKNNPPILGSNHRFVAEPEYQLDGVNICPWIIGQRKRSSNETNGIPWDDG